MTYADDIVDIGPKERAVFVGRTMSGKTTLAKHLLPQYPFVVVIDPKGTFELPGSRIATTPEELRRLPVQPYEPQIYRPHEQYWTVDAYDEVFRTVYQRRNTTCYVDEVYGVMRGPQVPLYYRAIITRGAELHIRVISATQRPSRIPLEILTESDHYVLYTLTAEDDVKRMAEHMGQTVLEPLTVEHSFYYYRVGGQNAPRVYKLRLPEEAA